MADTKRRPGRLACPVCKRETDAQEAYMEPEHGVVQRLFQNFICDTPDCPVSSFKVEWRIPARVLQPGDKLTIEPGDFQVVTD